MKLIRCFCIFLILPICMLFNSCQLFNRNEYSDTVDESAEYGKSVLNQILDSVERKDKDGLLKLFSSKVNNRMSNFESIDELFKFYKGIRQSVDYNYSTETDIVEGIEHYKFDECLACVKTTENSYWFEFLICKNKDAEGIVSLVISTKKSKETPEYSEYINKVFDEAEYLNENYFGVSIFK